MSSISDAIAKNRPDLNRKTKFQRNGETSERIETGNEAPELVYTPGDDLPLPEKKSTLGGIFTTGMLASTRSRVLATMLGALTLGLGVGYFPRVNRVSGKSGAQPAELASASGAALNTAVSSELDQVEVASRASEPAAAPTPPPAVAQNAEPERVTVMAVKSKTPNVEMIQVVEKPLRVELQLKTPVGQTATTHSARFIASVPPSGEAVALAPKSIPAEVSDEDPAMVASASPAPGGVGEVLYEAMPSPEMTTDEPPAGERQGSGGSSARSAKAAPRADTISLSGIFWDKAKPMAMINGEIVEVGQKIGGAEVLEINPENVVLMHNGKQRSLTL